MKERFVNSLYFVIFCLLLISCDKPVIMEELLRAENLMSVNPDSALILLESTPFPDNKDKENQAYYCLLLTEAQDKTYYTFTSDSIIRIALDYYETVNDKQRLPKVYYYMGRVCHTLYDAPQAINYYLKAKDALPKDTDYALEARIYNQLGGLYVVLNFNENAASAYQKAYKTLSLAGDSVNLPYVLRNIARTYEATKQSDSAIFYYHKAIASATEVNNLYCEKTSCIELASIHLRAKNLTEAKVYIDRALESHNNIGSNPQELLVLGKFFNLTGQPDSARYYFYRSMTTDNRYTHAAAIRELALLEEKEQNYKQAIFYRHQYDAYEDSIEAMMNQKSVADMEHFYNYQQVENENNRLKIETGQKQLLYTRLFFSFIIVLILSVSLFFYYRQKKKKAMLLKEEELRYHEELYRKSKEKINVNLQEIRALQKNIETKSGQLDQLSRELIQTKAMLLEQENKHIELSIHHLSLQHQKLINSLIYKDVKKTAPYKIMSETIWFRFKEEVDIIYETFENKLRILYPSISEMEIKVCYFLKAKFSVSEIAMLLGRQKSSITSCRKRLYEKIKGQPGSAEALDRIIDNLD